MNGKPHGICMQNTGPDTSFSTGIWENGKHLRDLSQFEVDSIKTDQLNYKLLFENIEYKKSSAPPFVSEFDIKPIKTQSFFDDEVVKSCKQIQKDIEKMCVEIDTMIGNSMCTACRG